MTSLGGAAAVVGGPDGGGEGVNVGGIGADVGAGAVVAVGEAAGTEGGPVDVFMGVIGVDGGTQAVATAARTKTASAEANPEVVERSFFRITTSLLTTNHSSQPCRDGLASGWLGN